MTKPRIVIFMDGGLITEIVGDQEIDVLVVDLDTEGVENEKLTVYSGGPGSPDNVAYMFRVNVHIDPQDVIDMNAANDADRKPD